MRFIRYILICALLVLVPGTAYLGAQVAPGNGYSRLVTADVRGFVFYSDGTSPAARVPVRVWNIDTREFVLEAETNENGFYDLGDLEPGSYFVTFDWTKVKLTVVDRVGAAMQQPHDIIVVIPRSVGFVSANQLSSSLIAATLTESARRYEERRPRVVSP
jgi:hypothetical protein